MEGEREHTDLVSPSLPLMEKVTLASMEAILREALQSDLGIEVHTDDPELFGRKFYSFRRKARERGVDLYDELRLLTPPDGKESKMWIVKEQSNAA